MRCFGGGKGAILYSLSVVVCVALTIAGGLSCATLNLGIEDYGTSCDSSGPCQLYLSMRGSVVCMLVSAGVWVLLTVVSVAMKNVRIDVVVVATLFTCLTLGGHGAILYVLVGLHGDYFSDLFSSPPPPRALAKYTATYVLSFIATAVLAGAYSCSLPAQPD